MKIKEKTSLHQATETQLKKQILDLEKSLAGIMANRYTKQSKNVREARQLRHKLAVMKTILHQKELKAHE